jgi:hypothetical protein
VLLLVGIVVAVVGLWVVGVMSPATLSGGESGPVFPFRDQSEDGQVSVSVNASRVDPGDAVAVTVEVDGQPTSDAAVSVAGGSYATGENGSVVVRLDDPGRYEVQGTRPDGNRSGTAAVVVRRYRSDLVVSVPDRVVTNETVPVRVERANGSPVSATVRANGERVETGADGVANVSFATAGEYEVVASKEPTSTYRFIEGTKSMSVARRPVALVVTANASAPEVDDSVGVTVRRRDTGEPVNATLAVGSRTVVTGPDGASSLSFETAGPVTVRATANRTPAVRFLAGETRVDVQRIPVTLAVSVSPSRVPEGERARFVVRREDTGERVRASVSLLGTSYPTGADGRVSFPFYVPGTVSVTATKPDTSRETYQAASTTFLVDGPEVVADAVTVPESGLANASVRVNATLSNVGTAPATGDAVVTVGTVRTRMPTTVAAGETTNASWLVATPNATGNVTVTVAYEEVVVHDEITLSRPVPTGTDGGSSNGSASNESVTSGSGMDRTVTSVRVATWPGLHSSVVLPAIGRGAGQAVPVEVRAGARIGVEAVL